MADATRQLVVVDTAGVIALSAIDALPLLDILFGRVVVPLTVWEELIAKPGAPEPERLRSLRGFHLVPVIQPPPATFMLDEGEQQVIAVALSLRGTDSVALLDERAARRVAREIGVAVVGTVGALVEAKRRGAIDSVKPRIDLLVARGFRLGSGVVTAALVAAGEGPAGARE